MTHKEFSQFENCCVEMQLKSGEIVVGIAADILKYAEKKTNTEYRFVGIDNLSSWIKANENSDELSKEKLQSTIDIASIEKVRLLDLSNGSLINFSE